MPADLSYVNVSDRRHPTTSRCHSSSKFGERAFSHAGPSAWNSLSDSIRTEPNSAVFRKHLKTHFFVQHLTFVNLLFIDFTQR